MSSSLVQGSGLSVKSPISTGKPLNILVLSQNDEMRQQIENVLRSIVAMDRYVIYETNWNDLSVGVWSKKTALLVVSGPIPSPNHVKLLLHFLGDGGRLFAWCCETPPFGLPAYNDVNGSVVYGSSQTQPLMSLRNCGWGTVKDLNSVPPNFPKVLETNNSEGIPRPLTATVFGKTAEMSESVILILDGGALGGKAVLSQVHFEDSGKDESTATLLTTILNQNLGLNCLNIKAPEYEIGFLLGDDDKRIEKFLSSNPPRLEQPKLVVEFVPRGEQGPKPTHDLFPVHCFEEPKNFSTANYFRDLHTRDLGRLLIYTDVISTVMDVLKGNTLTHGFTGIARQQTAGRGRGKNVWLSPEGYALFAFQLHVSEDSGIGQRLSVLQHLGALAVVLSVPAHNEIGLKVKWPNDIYLKGQKIGGVLVESENNGKEILANIGIGVNVSNTHLTNCLQAALAVLDLERQDIDFSAFTTERLIATTLNTLEKFLDSVQEESLDDILRLYMENWIHSGEEEVTVKVSEENDVTCRVLNVDDCGFLHVQNIINGDVFSITPDGHSFDINEKLISTKL